MRAVSAPILILGLLLVAGAASALTIGTREIFAYTRSDTVSWKTLVDMDIASLSVSSTKLTIDGVGYDVQPTSGTGAVIVTHWSADERSFYYNRTPAATATVTVNNPGNLIAPYLGSTPLAQCYAANATCQWTITSGTSNLVRLFFDPTPQILSTLGNASAVQEPIVLEQPVAAPGGGGASAPVETLPGPLPPLPDPVKLIPRLGAFQWGSVLAGLGLVMSSSKRTQRLLPALARVPGPALPKALVGSLILVLVYFSTPT